MAPVTSQSTGLCIPIFPSGQFDPFRPKPLQKLPQSIRIIDGAALCAASAEESSAGLFATWKSQWVEGRFVRDPEGESGSRA
jgi:hypothetical protein